VLFGPIAYTKHHLSDRPNRFFDAQDAEKELACPLVTLKLRFIDFTKVVI
jgi:hypothetical protein